MNKFLIALSILSLAACADMAQNQTAGTVSDQKQIATDTVSATKTSIQQTKDNFKNAAAASKQSVNDQIQGYKDAGQEIKDIITEDN